MKFNKHYLFLLVFITANLFAENKLDALDKQSQDFFKAITGLEQNYLQEQIQKMKELPKPQEKKDQKVDPNNPDEKELTQEELTRNAFEKEQDIARLSSDIAKSKNLSDITIKSIYNFNDKNYVVFTQKQNPNVSTIQEISMNLEARYKRGDKILNHRIVDINRRTKTITLYKKIDDNYGYFIYLSSQGISVSELKKIVKDENKTKIVTVENVQKPVVATNIQNVNSKKITTNNNNLNEFQTEINKSIDIKEECIYQLRTNALNVRNEPNDEALILRVLKKNDKIVGKYNNGWLLVDTIYKFKSGDIMDVKGMNNWVSISRNLFFAKDNCF